MKHRHRFTLLYLALAAAALHAQLDRASLSGTVTDKSGAGAGAKVEIASLATGARREALSGGNGSYAMSLLPIGVYTVTVSRAGLRTA